MTVPVPEYIIGIGIPKGLTLNLPNGQHQSGIKNCISAPTISVGKVKVPAVQIPAATEVVTMKQCRTLGGQEEISRTINDLLDAGVLSQLVQLGTIQHGLSKSDG